MKLRFKNIPIATILLAIIFAIGILLFVSAYSKKGALSTYNLWGGKETIIESENKDTDNDGLRDWEENLYKTDSLNPDTDADGYLDGEEIDSGHNPLVQGPNDKQAFYPLPLGDKYNITNKVFADFESVLKAYIEQKDEYVRDHPEIENQTEYLAQTTQSTLNEMLRRAMLYNEEDWITKAEEVLAQTPEVFDIEIANNNVMISESNDKESQRIYIEKLLSYINSDNFLLKEQNFILIKDALTAGEFDQLDFLIQDNDYQINELLNTPVPSQLAEIHKNTLKTAIIARNIFVSLRGAQSDPIKALIATERADGLLKEWEEIEAGIHNLSI